MQTIVPRGNSLVDISSVSVSKTLPRTARIADFAKQLRNPHLYISGKFTVSAKHADTGLTLEDCIMQIFN